MQKDYASAFNAVDAAVDPGYYTRYLDVVSALDSIKTYKQRMFDLLAVRDGCTVLDIGCGTGEDAVALANLVSQRGRVFAVDNSQTMIDEARRRHHKHAPTVEFCLGDAHHLRFSDNSVDGCKSDRTFIHLKSPEMALREMVRVARPGARVVLCEPDWETLIVNVPEKLDRQLVRRILNFWCDSVPNGWMGRQLTTLCSRHGLSEIVVWPHTLVVDKFSLAELLFDVTNTAQRAIAAGVLSRDEAERWLSALKTAENDRAYFSAVTLFIVAGLKPECWILGGRWIQLGARRAQSVYNATGEIQSTVYSLLGRLGTIGLENQSLWYHV